MRSSPAGRVIVGAFAVVTLFLFAMDPAGAVGRSAERTRATSAPVDSDDPPDPAGTSDAVGRAPALT